MKRTLCSLLAVLMLLGMVGCASGDGDGTEPVVTVQPSGDVTEPAGDVTEPDVTEPAGDVTEPDVTGPAGSGDVAGPEASEPDATEPTGSEATGPDVTDPAVPDATEPGATVPGVDVPTEPDVTGPTEAAPSEPEVTEPTVPPATKPAPTEPPATKPAPTEPPATQHVHKYTSKVVKPTCTAKGYTKYTCSCGDSYKDDYVDKVAHSYSSKVVKPTCESKGYTLYTCSCGDSYKDNYTAAGSHDYRAGEVVEATMWQEGYTKYTCSHCGDSYEGDKTDKIPQQEFERMVAQAALKYINQFRVEQGDTEAQMLPGLTLVAEYRAVQLIDNFEHSTKDLREAHAYYQYGKYVDATEFGEDAKYSYWTSNCTEAIAARGGSRGTAEELGRGFAEQFLNSPGHWEYVGDSRFPFIGIGVSYDPSGWGGYYWNCCVLQTIENYG